MDLFENENEARGWAKNGSFKAGVSDYDRPIVIETGALIPWPKDPAATWMYYDCTLACFLDSGIVVHRRLPQVDKTADSLASCLVSDKNLEGLTVPSGVNLISRDKYEDVVQRMGHSRYWFRLYGQGLRVGYQVPIPGLQTIGGVEAIQYDDPDAQMAYNRIAGNYSGFTLWHGVWSLWYTVAKPPRLQQVPPPNIGAHIAGDAQLPAGMQSPVSKPDGESQPSMPAMALLNPVSAE